MLSISYVEWIDCVEGIYKRNNTIKSSLQLYPFYNIKNNYKELLKYDFYCKFIKSGLFLLDNTSMFVTTGYTMSKNDTSLRIATTISPLLFLTYNAFAKMIFQKHQNNRYPDISIYYSGNLDNNSFFYKNEYNDFYKELISYQDKFQFFIKLDVQNFFPSIDIELLFQDIQNTDLLPQELLFWKEFMFYIGNNRFPTIEHSVASSYFATEIYLEKIDNQVYNYFEKLKEQGGLSSFKIVRFVDDCYIFFDTEFSNNMSELFNKMINKISSIYHAKKLTLNHSKTSFYESKELKEVVKQAQYFDGKEKNEVLRQLCKDLSININNLFCDFITQLKDKEKIDINVYKDIFGTIFSHKDLHEFDTSELFNHILYNCHEAILKNKELVIELIEKKSYIIKFDTKSWAYILFIIKYEEESLLQLIDCDSNDIQDISFIIHYLSQVEFQQNIQLLDILKNKQEEQYNYIDLFCNKFFVNTILTRLEKHDANKQLYFLYQILDKHSDYYGKLVSIIYTYSKYFYHEYKYNYLESHSSFKSYFDGISTVFALCLCNNGNQKLKCLQSNKKFPKFFHEKMPLKEIYQTCKVDNSEDILKMLCDLRNDNNPNVHINANKIENVDKYKDSITQSLKLIDQMIEFLYNQKWIYKPDVHTSFTSIQMSHSYQYTTLKFFQDDKFNIFTFYTKLLGIRDDIVLFSENNTISKEENHFFEFMVNYVNCYWYISLGTFCSIKNQKENIKIPNIFCSYDNFPTIIGVILKYIDSINIDMLQKISINIFLNNEDPFSLIDSKNDDSKYSYQFSYNGSIEEFKNKGIGYCKIF